MSSNSGGSKNHDKPMLSNPEETAAPNGADNNTPESAHGLPTIRVILADTQAIYRVGTKKNFALEDDIRVVSQAEKIGQVLTLVSKIPADVLLFEASIPPNSPEAIGEVLKLTPHLKVIVLSPTDDEDTTNE